MLMTRLFVLVLPPLVGLFAICLGLIHTFSTAHHQLRDILQPADCEMPCFLGIHPGQTTTAEASAILRDHAWIDHMDIYIWRLHDSILTDYTDDAEAIPAWDTRYSSVRVIWQWSDASPPIFANSPASELMIRDDVVTAISLHSSIEYAYFLAVMGRPDRSSLTCTGASVGATWMLAGLYTEYPDQQLQISVRIPPTYCPTYDARCPIVPQDFWVGRTEVHLGAPPERSLDIDYGLLMNHIGCDFFRLAQAN